MRERDEMAGVLQGKQLLAQWLYLLQIWSKSSGASSGQVQGKKPFAALETVCMAGRPLCDKEHDPSWLQKVLLKESLRRR